MKIEKAVVFLTKSIGLFFLFLGLILKFLSLSFLGISDPMPMGEYGVTPGSPISVNWFTLMFLGILLLFISIWMKKGLKNDKKSS